MFPHEKAEPRAFGRSPGNGMTAIPLSREPLASEGEATPGPDDWNPFEEAEFREEWQLFAGEGGPRDEDELPGLFGKR